MTPDDDRRLEGEHDDQYLHLGIMGDRQRAARIPKDERCERCEGTGNELFAMYRRCSDCDGTGRKQEEAQQ